MVLITGNTYPVRAALKSLGGRWDATRQGWNVPASVEVEARAIVAAAGPDDGTRSSRPARANRGSVYSRFAGGGESYRNRNGRCEDAPCCGCCS